MYIRRTTIKSRKNGAPYYTHRLVESVRTEKGVRQRTILNLGKNFPYPRERWPELAARIKEIVTAKKMMFHLPSDLENVAQRYAAQIIEAEKRASKVSGSSDSSPDYQEVDINTIELIRPRDIGAEHVAITAFRQLGLEKKLNELGFNKHQTSAAISVVIGRMIKPGSELSTHNWLQDRTGLGELIEYDYGNIRLGRMYQASDMLLKNKEELERHLYDAEKSLFEFEETITLYDLTNTYFEGSGKFNDLAARGKSKEKRTDCPLVTLALVLDGSGFPKRSEVFAGNASEPATFSDMIGRLEKPLSDPKQKQVIGVKKPTIIMDAGIAIEDNITWLKENGYNYLVVSRKRHREFEEEKSQIVKKDRDCTIKAYKVMNNDTAEVELYCHSTRREEKEKAISDRFALRFEEAVSGLAAGLCKKGCTKKYDKVIERIGRIKEKYSRVAANYAITVKEDKKTGNASEVILKRKETLKPIDTYPGVYCLRTNHYDWDEATLWKTYTMLTDLEGVFRSLKSELGLRPVYHQKTDRVSGHLFISLLAYHLIHTIRIQLKKQGINYSWSTLREQLGGQQRITITMREKDGSAIHIRKSTRPEPRQQLIFDALNISHYPGKVTKKKISP